MEVKEILNENLKRILEITYPSQVIEERCDKELTNQQATFTMKGFRAGKVPRQQAEAMLGSKIKNDVINKAIYESSHDFLKKNNLKPFTEPEITITSAPENGKDLKYTISFELTPNVPLITPSDLTITKYTPLLEEEDVEKYITQLINNAYDYEPAAVEHKAQLKDKVEIDFEGKVNDRSFKGGSASNFQIILGQNKVIADLEEGLKGVVKDEQKDITAFFPTDYHDSNLRGKMATFNITVKNVLCPKALTRQEVIDKLNYKEEDVFKSDMKKHLENECNKVSERLEKKDLIKEILSKYSDFEVPTILIEHEKKSFKNFSSIEDEHKINERVKLGLLFNHYAANNKINLTPAEVTNRLTQTLELYSSNNTEYKEHLYNLYSKDMDLLMKLGSEIMEEKIFEQLLKDANKVEQTITVDELLQKENANSDESSSDSN